MENYEEKYKEMKKRVLAIGQGYVKEVDYSSPRSIAEYIDPELRESEDERIRKAQLNYWRSVGGKEWYGVPVQETIAWLEKQGEQKPTPKYKIGDCIKYRGEEYKITNITVTANNFYYNVSLIKEPSDWGEVVAAIGMAAEEKMFKIEQTSAWSEEDEYQINTILHGLDLKRELYKKEGNQVEEKRYKTQYDWLKSLKDGVKRTKR